MTKCEYCGSHDSADVHNRCVFCGAQIKARSSARRMANVTMFTMCAPVSSGSDIFANEWLAGSPRDSDV